MIEKAVLIPREIYCGDEAEYRVFLDSTIKISPQIFAETEIENFFKDYTDDFSVLQMGIYEIENETALVLKIIPWKNGQINFPSLEIGENKIEIPSVEVSSILEVTGEQTLQSTLPPFAVPGTSYVFYGLILFLIVLLLFLSMLIFKFSTVKSFVDFIFRNKYSRHYKKTMRKIVALKKNMEKLSNKDFAKELLEIARYYLQGYLKQDLSSFTSTEIKTRLYFLMEELEKEYEKKHTDISEKDKTEDEVTENISFEKKCDVLNLNPENIENFYQFLFSLDEIRYSIDALNNQIDKDKLVEKFEKLILSFGVENVTV